MDRCGKCLVFFLLLSIALSPICWGNTSAAVALSATTSGHPRLFFTPTDVTRMRGWANDSNPVWVALRNRANKYKLMMGPDPAVDTCFGKNDEGKGSADGWVQYPVEDIAALFAFMSLVDPDPAKATDWATRAHTLIMIAFNGASNCAPKTEDQPGWCYKYFSTWNRSRWSGQAFGLTVDWIYQTFTKEEKRVIRAVFLKWVDQNKHANITANEHPEPFDTYNDPVLVKDNNRVRWFSNNYASAHMRNIAMMTLAMDEADDSGHVLTSQIKDVTGAWLYITDYNQVRNLAGGLPGEGFEYGPQQLAYVAQTMLALHTAGHDDPVVDGPQTIFSNVEFWKNFETAYFQLLSPIALPLKGADAWLGSTYQPLWYGDGQHTWNPDWIALVGILAMFDINGKNTDRVQDWRWLQKNTPIGLAKDFLGRVDGAGSTLNNILYFAMFDPAAPEPKDPRPKLDKDFYAPGLNMTFSRTSWIEADNPNVFAFKMSWNALDHQHADAGQWWFWRKGEWLTTGVISYGGEHLPNTECHNGLAIHGYPQPSHYGDGGYRTWEYDLGSHWTYVASGDPKNLASSLQPKFVYASGDMTDLYNSSYEASTDVAHASRSIIFLKPDRVVTYDRAESKTSGPGHFKRWWLNLLAPGNVSGNLVTVHTPGSQEFYIRSLLPAGASITAAPLGKDSDGGTPLNAITDRVKIEAAGDPQTARFLTVMQGADKGVAADSAALVQSSSGTVYDGAVFNKTAVLFARDMYGTFSSTTFSVPQEIASIVVTGLKARGGYTVAQTTANGTTTTTITVGGPTLADSGGVLAIGPINEVSENSGKLSCKNSTIQFKIGHEWISARIPGLPRGATTGVKIYTLSGRMIFNSKVPLYHDHVRLPPMVIPKGRYILAVAVRGQTTVTSPFIVTGR